MPNPWSLLFALAFLARVEALAIATQGAAASAREPQYAISARFPPASPQEPHFLSSTDNFLRSSSRRVGDAAAKILGVQGSLDDMRQDLSGEYELWQKKKSALAADKGRLLEELEKLQKEALEQKMLGEEKVRLEGELALHAAETKKSAEAKVDKKQQWAPQLVGLQKDIALIEDQIRQSQVYKIQQLNAAANKTGETQARNRLLQTTIFSLNQQVAQLERELSNRTIVSKQVHSKLLSEVAGMQKNIHALQDEVVARAQLQLEVQRRWKRLSAQATEVVEQKEQLQKARKLCEQDLHDLDGKIASAQAALKASSTEMATCQRLDAEAQIMQGKLNECQARNRR